MENLHMRLSSPVQPRNRSAVLVGVVASGNCEVLLERADPSGGAPACDITVHTSALGFSRIWEAVLADFTARHELGGLRIEINDAGATPAIVSLRLEQSIEVWEDEDA